MADCLFPSLNHFPKDQYMTTPAPDDEDSLFGFPPPSPARGRSPSPQLALPTTGSSIAADLEEHNNVRTIALPSAQSYSELASTPATLLLSSQPTASTWAAPAHRPSPIPPPPNRSRTVNNNAQRAKTDKEKARASRSSTPRLPPPNIFLPNPDEPPPPNFPRNPQALLGLVGHVAGVKPSHLSKRHRERDQGRGATPVHPTIVEERDPPPIGQRSFVVQPESLPEPPPREEIVAPLVKQQNISLCSSRC